MTAPKEDAAARTVGTAPTPPLSAGLRLEVAILDADQAAPAPATAARQAHRTMLVVAAEPDLHRYVRECLRERTDVRVLEAATVAAAVTLAEHLAPVLLIVDQPEGEMLAALSRLPVVLIVDGVPRGVAPETRLGFLARPFTGERLLGEVDRLLG